MTMTGLAVLDVFISLVFIFLLYSLFATAIAESITSFFGSRGKNLYTGIDRLLSDKSTFLNFSFFSLFYVKSDNNLTKQFYHHPSIKYLGKGGLSNNRPSYIKPERFGETLVDLLKAGDLEDVDNIRVALGEHSDIDRMDLRGRILEMVNKLKSEDTKQEVDEEELEELTEILGEQLSVNNRRKKKESIFNEKIKWKDQAGGPLVIDADTRYQLRMIWDEAANDLEKFKDLVAEWYDQQMDRITGWYKRKVSFLTFFVGLGIAIYMDVDTIFLAQNLSRYEDMREIYVEGAKSYLEKNPDKPSEAAAAEEEIKKLGSAWSIPEDAQRPVNPLWGQILTALAISLGAQFWFDLLNKLMKLRSALPIPTGASKTAAGGKESKENTKAVG